jgi:two-component system sensor histidine kinase KdpD
VTRIVASCLEALLAVAAIAWLTSALLPVLGLASAALLFLLPVLLAAARGGVGPGLIAAFGGAAAYNYFLLEPRYTFRVHELDNLISVIVLGAVAVVTSRLATQLMARESEANLRAQASEEAAALSSLLASGPSDAALAAGVDFISERYGQTRLLDETALTQGAASLLSLDRAAAAWALHNGDITGHGTETMATADWTFVPLAPKNRADNAIAAMARPADGRIRPPAELDQVRQLCLLLGQCRDRASLEAERRQRELLEEAEHLRRTFLASLAHDFRTPLTVISGRLKLLAQHSPEASDALVAAQRLDRMMADLVGAARIEAGSLVVASEKLDLVDVIGATCDGLTLPQGIALRRAIPADLPFVIGDPVLLHHVLANLIDNALRHASSAVVVSASMKGDCVLLSVADDGAGVPEAERDRVFERFSRAEGSDRGDGSGLGLAIVKGFADAMHMAVVISDSAAGGAQFTLAMPTGSGLAA